MSHGSGAFAAECLAVVGRVVIIFIFFFIFFVVVVVFLFFLVWLLSQEDIGSYQKIRGV